MGRFFTQDRFAEKYLNFTPYQYAANNPIKFIDVNGDSLNVAGTDDDMARFLNMINTGLDGYYTVNNSDGNITLEKTDKDDSDMSEQQKNFLGALQSVIGDKNTTSVELVSDNDDILIGSFNTGQIDVCDLEIIGNSNLKGENVFSAQGFIAHELTEQYSKQVDGNLDYNSAHFIATQYENSVNGSVRDQKAIIYDAVVPATGQKLQLISYNVNAGGKNFNEELRTINEGRLIRATAR